MAPLKIRLLGSLKLYAGKEEIEMKIDREVRLRDVLRDLVRREPSLSRAIEEDGRVKPGYLIFINDADYMVFEGLETIVRDSDIITILPVSHGGANV
ncbi:MAG: MoaD/ThiS family protein [Sulfolobales archaeon]